MLFGRLMGIVPLGAGLTFLAIAWNMPFAPWFMRLFFSFIALGFVLTGAGLLSGRVTDPERLLKLVERMHAQRTPRESQHPSGPVGYACPSCGAGIGAKADVSPHGDVKCMHCDRWFNIHQSPNQ